MKGFVLFTFVLSCFSFLFSPLELKTKNETIKDNTSIEDNISIGDNTSIEDTSVTSMNQLINYDSNQLFTIEEEKGTFKNETFSLKIELSQTQTIKRSYYLGKKMIYTETFDSKEQYEEEKYIVLEETILFFKLANKRILLNEYKMDGENQTSYLSSHTYEKIIVQKMDEENILIVGELIDENNNKELELLIFNCHDLSNPSGTKTLHGKGNETIQKVVIYNHHIYLALFKEALSGGDYGNGGLVGSSQTLCLVKVDETLQIEAKCTFNTDSFTNLEIVSSNLILSSTSDTYLFDEALNQILGLKFNAPSIFTKCTINKTNTIYLSRFLKNGIEVYSLDSLEKIHETGWESSESYLVDSVLELADHYYGFYKNDCVNVTALFCIDEFIRSSIYLGIEDKPNNINRMIDTFNKELPRESAKTIGNFDSNKAGTYLTYYFYNTSIFTLELTSKITVKPSYNIMDGCIYPSSYELISNLDMVLDGVSILNHSIVIEEGEHQIDYYYDGALYDSFTFFINNNMESDKTDSKEKYELNDEIDYFLNVGEKIRVDYELPKSETVETFYVNQEAYSDFEIKEKNKEKNYIYLLLETKDEGINRYIINGIKTDKRYIALDECFLLQGLKEEPSYTKNVIINQKTIDYEVHIDNTTQTFCYFYVDLYQNGERVERRKACLETIDITLNNQGDEIRVGLASDIGYKNLIEEELFKVTFNNEKSNKTVSLELDQKEENKSVLTITTPINNDLMLYSMNDQTIFEKTKTDHTVIILFCAVIALVTLSILIAIVVKNNKGLHKKNKASKNKMSKQENSENKS